MVAKWYREGGEKTLRFDYPLTCESIVFDIGGYQGYFVREIVARYHPHVYVFEPVPEFFEQLVKEFGANPKAKICNYGLSDSDSISQMLLAGESSTIYMDGEMQAAVQLRDIQTVIKELGITRIDLIKINIEGAEYKLLRRMLATGLVSICQDIQVQFHTFYPNSGRLRSEIRSALQKTHFITYDYPFVWENWRKRSTTQPRLEARKITSLTRPTSNAVASGQDRPRWTRVLPAPVRSVGRPLLHKWRHFYGVSREKLREKLAAPSVTSCLTGGCANQIFQYATGLALARRLGVDLKLDVSWYETATPDMPRMYSLRLFRGVDARVVRSLLGRIIREEGFQYNPAIFENAPRKCSLVGYWQCEKYFFELRDELRERLVPREPLPVRSVATERAILEAGERSVFVHVRRTDYVGNPYHVVLSMDYYREAAALIAAKIPSPVFFIFSDDPEWCEANFKLPYPTTIVRNSDRTEGHHLGREDADLYVMRLCGHAIIANSSYGWWGAWLGADMKGGIVIAPKIWFGPAFEVDPGDIVPNRWIRL